jgi:hypothetical protein
MKVLVNGCSHVQGCELHEDAEVSPTLTWPNYVADWQVVNIAQAGSSNDSIRRRTVQHLEEHHYDFVYIQWSHFDRLELAIPFWQERDLKSRYFSLNSGNAIELHPRLNNNGALMHVLAQSIFRDQFDDEWFREHSVVQMLALQQYLDSKNIDWRFGFSYQVPGDTSLHRCLKQNNLVLPSWVDFCDTHGFKRIEQHYELEAHWAFAKFIQEKLQ